MPGNVRSNTKNSSQNRVQNNGQHRPWRCRSRAPQPRWELVRPGEPVSVDCEGIELLAEVGIAKKGLASLAIYTMHDQLVYDPFAYYPEGTPWRLTPKFVGIDIQRHELKKENGARPIAEIIENVCKIFDISGVIIGHAIGNDMAMLRGLPAENWYTKWEYRDTQTVAEWRQYGKNGGLPSLKSLAENVLNKVIQGGRGHTAAEDARITMELYLINKHSIDQQQSRAILAARKATEQAAAKVQAEAGEKEKLSRFVKALGPLQAGEEFCEDWTGMKKRRLSTGWVTKESDIW